MARITRFATDVSAGIVSLEWRITSYALTLCIARTRLMIAINNPYSIISAWVSHEIGYTAGIVVHNRDRQKHIVRT